MHNTASDSPVRENQSPLCPDNVEVAAISVFDTKQKDKKKEMEIVSMNIQYSSIDLSFQYIEETEQGKDTFLFIKPF